MKRFLAAASLLLGIGVSAFAQTSSISGTVSDITDSVIPGVKVMAINTGTGSATSSLTSDTGVYNLLNLPPGPYKVTAVLTGFQTASSIITLGSADAQRLNLSLKVGNTETEIILDDEVNFSDMSSQS